MKRNDVTKLFLSHKRCYTSRYLFYKNREICIYNEEGWHFDFTMYPNIISCISDTVSFCYTYDNGLNLWYIFLEEVCFSKGKITKYELISFQDASLTKCLCMMDDALKNVKLERGMK